MKENGFELSTPHLETLVYDAVRQIGYSSVSQAGGDIVEKLTNACEDVFNLIHPAYVFERTPLYSWKDGVIYGEDITIRSGKWSSLLSYMDNPEIIYFFAVTLGGDIDRVISEKQDDFMLQAYLLDVAGSVLAEYFAEQIDRYISEILESQGYQSTARFSPGYCDWELKDGQENIFKFLRPDAIGLTINSSGLMIPKKSVSAAMIGAQAIPYKTPCRFCKNECDYRRA
jgi:hypothetical protein